MSLNQCDDNAIKAQSSNFSPMRLVEIEIGEPLLPISAFDEDTCRSYQHALCLVRLHSQPLGWIELQLGVNGIQVDEYALCIWHALSIKINEHLHHDGLLPVTRLDVLGLLSSSTSRCLQEREHFFTHAPFVSIIVATHDRPECIKCCLQSLLSLYYPHYEIIIVDNAPGTNATANFIQQIHQTTPQVHYIREDYPGVSRARNRGIMAAKGEILAFTDDDVIVDAYWLLELVRGFSFANDVACVTGLALPLEMETPAQMWFEKHEGLSDRFTQRIFDMNEHHLRTPLYPYTSGQFGTGSNMAFTSAFLRSVGGFDPALGPGSRAPAGEELALFFQVVIRGHKLVYTPSSLLYHLHRRDYTNLCYQIYNYGIGLTAYLMKVLLDEPRFLTDIITKIPYGLYFILSSSSQNNRKKSLNYPKALKILEIKGMLYGAFAYLYSRWRARGTSKRVRKKDPASLSFT